MTSMRIGPPSVVLGSRKAGPSAKARQKAGAYFSTFQAIASGEAEHR